MTHHVRHGKPNYGHNIDISTQGKRTETLAEGNSRKGKHVCEIYAENRRRCTLIRELSNHRPNAKPGIHFTRSLEWSPLVWSLQLSFFFVSFAWRASERLCAWNLTDEAVARHDPEVDARDIRMFRRWIERSEAGMAITRVYH